MNFKIKNRKMLNADIISPEIVYASFSDELVDGVAEGMVNSMNCGHEMLTIYSDFRDDLHITNVADMLKKMEAVYQKWSEEDYRIRRSSK